MRDVLSLTTAFLFAVVILEYLSFRQSGKQSSEAGGEVRPTYSIGPRKVAAWVGGIILIIAFEFVDFWVVFGPLVGGLLIWKLIRKIQRSTRI